MEVDPEILKQEVENEIKNVENTEKEIKLSTKNKEPDPIDLDKIYSEIHTEPKDAYYTQNPFTLYPHVDGVDFAISMEEAKKLLEEDKEEYVIPLKITHPAVTTDKIGSEGFPDLLGEFSTTYNAGATARTTNLKLASNKINNTVVMPGETFSYNKVVGKRTVAAGYKEAPAYAGGKVVNDIGGGICQITSTLYNAVILAELEVTERSNHSMIVTYVKPSMDAAIAGDYKDLKFVNNQDVPIYIEGYTSGKNVYFNIYGEETRPANRKVTYESEVVSEQDPGTQFVATGDPVGTMSVSQGKHVGYVAQLWKVVTVDGVEESREVFNKSTYKASPKIVNVGTASEDPNASATIGAALATGDEGTIYAAVAQFTAAAAATPEQPAENQSAEEQAIVGDGQVDVSGDNGGNGQ